MISISVEMKLEIMSHLLKCLTLLFMAEGHLRTKKHNRTNSYLPILTWNRKERSRTQREWSQKETQKLNLSWRGSQDHHLRRIDIIKVSGSYGGTGGSNARGQNSSVKKLKNVKNNHFEKEKKAVSYKCIIYYSIGCKEKLSGNIRRKISEIPAKCKSTIRSKRKENESSCFEICN